MRGDGMRSGISTARRAFAVAVAAFVAAGALFAAGAASAGMPACTIKGTKGADRLTGTAKRDVICGFSGADTLVGLAGNDVLIGGPGNDVLRGGRSNDRIFAGPGNDRLFGEPQNDRLYGGPGNDLLDGGSGLNFYFTGPGKNRCRDTETDTVTAGCDDTAPSLVEMTVTPDSVDTSEESRMIEFSLRVTDDLSGLRGEPSVRIVHPVTGQKRWPAVERTGGNLMDGTFGGRLRLDRFAASGTWTFEVSFQDRQGNARYLEGPDLAALGLPAGFEQTGIGDDTKPQIESIQLDRTSVDSSTAAQTITVTMRVTDDFTGIGDEYFIPVTLTAHAPDWKQQRSAEGVRRISGTRLDGIYQGALVLPRYSRRGTWTLAAGATDGADNTLMLSSSDLRKRGMVDQITQTGLDDTTPPTLIELSITPERIDTSDSSRTVDVRMRITDDLSGLDDRHTISARPSNGGGFGTFLDRVSGTDLDSVYEGPLTIPDGTAPGRITFLPGLYDRVSNYAPYRAEDLTDLGFANWIENGPLP